MAATETEVDLADGSDEEEEVNLDSAAATKKKKKKKKKKAVPEGVAVETALSTATPGRSVAGSEHDIPPSATEAALKEEEAEEEEGKCAPIGQPKVEGACDSEDDDDEEEAAPVAGAKKKKKRGKKKGSGSKVAAEQPGKGVYKYCPDEEFQVWVCNALEATANGTENMSREELLRPPQAFWGYKYTGDLRPAFVTPQRRMPAGILMPDYATEPEGVSHSERAGLKEVPILAGGELETMRAACRLGREVLDIAARCMRPGVTGDEIDRVVFQACIDRNIYPSPLNYYRFPKSVCVSPNEVICHGIPDSRPIEEGDIVNLDVSVYHQGYHSDLNETFFVGECDEESHRLVRTAYCALHAAAQLIRPGTFYRDLGTAIHNEASKNNCAVVTTYCGHGVGQLFHGPPKVPHYRKNKAVGIMKPGHVFTVEPMINLGGNGGDKTWPDNWTAVTRDGKRSAQFEHTFLVTDTGFEVLTCRHGTDKRSMPQFDPTMFQL